MSIGFRIREQRLKLKLSQAALAEEVGITQVALCDIENGKTEWPRSNSIAPLADALKVTTDYLLRGEEEAK